MQRHHVQEAQRLELSMHQHLSVTCANCLQGPSMLQSFLQHPEIHSSLPMLGGMCATSRQDITEAFASGTCRECS